MMFRELAFKFSISKYIKDLSEREKLNIKDRNEISFKNVFNCMHDIMTYMSGKAKNTLKD